MPTTINLALVAFFGVAIVFAGAGHLLAKRLGRPGTLPYNLGVWLAVLIGALFAWNDDLRNWWAATAGLAAVGALWLSWQLILARRKAGASS